MSTVTEDDIELKDMVTQLLDSNGVLNKLKAQLRAHVYSALESGQVNPKSKLLNPALKEFQNSTSGRLVLCLVREFLEFFELDFTLAVFDPETNMGKELRHRNRSKLIDSLGLTELVDPKVPLISEIMRLSKVSVLKSESPTPTEISEEDDRSLNQPSIAHDQSNNSQGNDGAYSSYKNWMPDEDQSITPDLSLNLQPLSTKKEDTKLLSSKNKVVSSLSFDSKELSISLDKVEEKERTRKISFRAEKDVEIKSDKIESEIKESKIPETQKPLSLLGDLPALGLGSENSRLGDLPPLGGGPRGELPPLSGGRRKELPSLSLGKELSPLKTRESHLLDLSRGSLEKTLSKESDNDEKSDKDNREKEKENDYSVSENISEELDTFSSQSNAEQFTKDENVINSDTSLKADHVESL